MAAYDVAHIREQGVDLIIIPVNETFRHKSNLEQNNIKSSLQRYASNAGLAGTVVLVWDAGRGQMGFLAPGNWHPFFQGIDLGFVAMNINRRLECG